VGGGSSELREPPPPGSTTDSSSDEAHSAVIDQSTGDDAVARHQRLAGRSRSRASTVHYEVVTFNAYTRTALQ